VQRFEWGISIVVIQVERSAGLAYNGAMIKLNIRALAATAGMGNPLALSRQSGLAYAMCHKLWNDQQTRIDLSTIDRLCEVLMCSPGDLFLRNASPARKEDAPISKGTLEAAPAPASGGCRRIRWID
jgi:putative transcriptional regulator